MKNKVISLLLSIMMLLTSVPSMCLGVQAAASGEGGNLPKDTIRSEGAVLLPDYWEDAVAVRFYPVEYREDMTDANLPARPDIRWAYENCAVYAMLGNPQVRPGWKVNLEEDGSSGGYAFHKNARVYDSNPEAHDNRYFQYALGDNVFKSWVAQGMSVGLHNGSIGAALNEGFFGANGIASDPAKATAFWEGYKQVYSSIYNDSSIFDKWEQAAAQGNLAMEAEFLIPIFLGQERTSENLYYFSITDFLCLHSMTTAVATGGFEPFYEKKYLEAVPGWNTGSLGCRGAGVCTNPACADQGHLRYALGFPTAQTALQIYPNASKGSADVANYYTGWGYFNVAPGKPKAIQLIEKNIYKENGVVIGQEVVYSNSWDTKQDFIKSGQQNRKADLVKSKSGTKFDFKEYRYTTSERDAAGKDKTPPIDIGKPTKEPSITVDVSKLKDGKNYSIYVTATYETIGEKEDPSPNRIEEYELSEFWDSMANFTESGVLKSANVSVSGSVKHYDYYTDKKGRRRKRGRTVKVGDSTHNYKYTFTGIHDGMEFIIDGIKNAIWYTGDINHRGTGLAKTVTPGRNPDVGLWVNKTRVGENLNIAEWKNTVPNELNKYFEKSMLSNKESVSGYKDLNAGSRSKNEKDDVVIRGGSQRADWFDDNDNGHSYVRSVTYSGNDLPYPVTITYHRYNPSENSAIELPQGEDKYVLPPDSSVNAIRFTTQAPTALKIYPEVDMTYDTRDGDVKDVIVVGDTEREIKPISYHRLDVRINTTPRFSSSTVATDSRARAFSERRGGSYVPIVYSGGDMNIANDQTSLITATSYVLDIEPSEVKEAWGNGAWNPQKVHNDFKANIDFETNARLIIHDDKTSQTQEMLVTNTQGGVNLNTHNLFTGANVAFTKTKTYRLKVEGHELVDTGGLSADIVDKMRIRDLIKVFEQEQGDFYPKGHGSKKIDEGKGWYTEDSTVLVVKEFVDVLTLPNAIFTEKIPITFGPPSPSNLNDLFSRGYNVSIDWQYVINTKNKSMSPFANAGGSSIVMPSARFGYDAPIFVLSDATVLDMRQLGSR